MAILPMYGFLLKNFGKISTQIFDFNQKTTKHNFTNQDMTILEFSGRSVKYTRREFYISRLGSAIYLKFSPELDIVKTNLLEKFQPNWTSCCPVIDY